MINMTAATSGAETAYHSGTPEFTPVLSRVHVTRVTLVLCVCCVGRCLSFFFWPLCCLSFFDLRILITPLVSSNVDHWVVCPSIYGFWLPLWYLQILTIELSVRRFKDSDYPFGIFKLFVINRLNIQLKKHPTTITLHLVVSVWEQSGITSYNNKYTFLLISLFITWLDTRLKKMWRFIDIFI